MGLDNPHNGQKHRRWTFAGCEYDELSRTLTVSGRTSRLTGKPIALLALLLAHPDKRMTRRDMIDTVWGPHGSDDSLTEAIYRLRRELPGAPDDVLMNYSGDGYGFVVDVAECPFVNADESMKPSPGDPVPRKKHWRFVLPLGGGPAGKSVWLIDNPKIGSRVLKMTRPGAGLQVLKWEVTISKLLRASLANRTDFVPILDMSLDEAPYYVEADYCGQNLLQWAEGDSQTPGHWEGTSHEARIGMIVDLTKAVAAAIQVGMLHRDIQPRNILVIPRADGTWHVRLADFGAASVENPERLAALGITDPGSPERVRSVAGATMYTAPELLEGEPSTIKSEVYSLGILLYQMMTGSFQRPISPGWEHEVEDLLVRQDIAAAARADPMKRLGIEELVRKLESLDRRRRAAARDRVMRILSATAAVFLAAFVLCALFYRQAAHERDIAKAINRFLTEDLLSLANPYKTGVIDETLVEAIRQASPQIELRFAGQPALAASLHHTIAKALDKRMDYPDGDQEYSKSAALYKVAEGPLSAQAVVTQMQRAAMHVRDTEPGSLDQGKAIFHSQQPIIDRIDRKPPELAVWTDYAQGLIQMYSGDLRAAITTFEAGLKAAQNTLRFDPGTILTMQQLVAVAETRTGQPTQAEVLIRQMMETVRRLNYTDKPNLTNLSVNLAQAYMAEQKNREAIAEVNAVYPALVQQMGETNQLTLTALGVRAQAESNLGLWDDAARDSLFVNHIGAGKNVYMDAGSLSDAALSQCRGGHLVEGEKNAQQAIAIGRKMAEESSGLDASFKFSLATCKVGLRQFDEAQTLLSTIDVSALAQEYSDADWNVDYQLTEAEIALGRQEYQSATRQLALAKPLATRSGGAPYRLAWFDRLSSRLPSSANGNKS